MTDDSGSSGGARNQFRINSLHDPTQFFRRRLKMRQLARLVSLAMTALLAAYAPAMAATFSGTLKPPAAGAASSLTWTGNVTGVIGDTGGTGLFNPPCTSTLCDIYTLTVNVPATFYATNPNYAVHVNVTDVPNVPVTDLRSEE